MKNVITPVGLSVFTNYFDFLEKQGSPNTRLLKTFKEFKNSAKYPADTYERYKPDLESLTKSVLDFAKTHDDAAAEITSINKIVQELKNENSQEIITVYLLASDTILSKLAAKIISSDDVCQKHFTDVEQMIFQNSRYNGIIKGLTVVNRVTFIQKGMINLIRMIRNIAKCNYGAPYWPDLVLNITGGYKGTVPYLTILAQVYQIPMYYVFEKSDDEQATPELINIPRVPITVDWGLFEQHANILREIENGHDDFETFKQQHPQEIEGIASCIEEMKDEATQTTVGFLSPLGAILWEEFNSYHLVRLSPYSACSRELKTKRDLVESAIKKLFQELTNEKARNGISKTEQMRRHLQQLSDQSNLNHTGTIEIDQGNETKRAFIFKYSPGDAEARLCYDVEIENTEITLTIFDCVAGNFDHNKQSKYYYRKQFESSYRQHLHREEYYYDYYYLQILPKQ